MNRTSAATARRFVDDDERDLRYRIYARASDAAHLRWRRRLDATSPHRPTHVRDGSLQSLTWTQALTPLLIGLALLLLLALST